MSLSIPATIEGVTFETSDVEAKKSYIPFCKKTKERIANLGLSYFEKDEKGMTYGKFLQELEVAVWKSKKDSLATKKTITFTH